MQQKTLQSLQFQKKLAVKSLSEQLFRCVWPEGFKVPRCGQAEAYFHQ